MKIDLPVDLLYELSHNNYSNQRLKSIIIKTFIDKGLKIIEYSDIKSYSDACQYLGISNDEPKEEKKLTAYIKLTTIIKALNGDWIPDFNNENQYKYYNWFKLENGEFVFDDTICTCRNMIIPSAIYLKSEELAIYCKDNFIELYKELYQ